MPDKTPAFQLPLRNEDIAPVIELQALLDEIYERSSYDLKLDYTQEPVPPFAQADADWIDRLLKQKGLR